LVECNVSRTITLRQMCGPWTVL